MTSRPSSARPRTRNAAGPSVRVGPGQLRAGRRGFEDPDGLLAAARSDSSPGTAARAPWTAAGDPGRRQVIAELAAGGPSACAAPAPLPPSGRAARTRRPRPRAGRPGRASPRHRRTAGRARTAPRPPGARRARPSGAPPRARDAGRPAHRRRPRHGGRAAPGRRRRAPPAGQQPGVQLGLAARRDRRLDRHPDQLVPEAQVGPVGYEDPGSEAAHRPANPARPGRGSTEDSSGRSTRVPITAAASTTRAGRGAGAGPAGRPPRRGPSAAPTATPASRISLT